MEAPEGGEDEDDRVHTTKATNLGSVTSVGTKPTNGARTHALPPISPVRAKRAGVLGRILGSTGLAKKCGGSRIQTKMDGLANIHMDCTAYGSIT